MKIFVVLFSIVLSMPAVAQDMDSARLRITYEAGYTYTVGEKSKGDDVMFLELGNHSSHFYSKLFTRKEEIRDSMNRRASVSIRMFDEATADLEAGQTYDVFKNFPDVGKLTYTEHILLDYFKYEETMPRISWTLLEGDTLIVGYKCQRAVGKLRGREWKVWFTPDIPVQDGPWKLCGLPGLILWASDVSGVFSFRCIGIESMRGKPIMVKKQKYVICTPEKMNDIYANYRKNFVKYIARTLSPEIWTNAKRYQSKEKLEDKKFYLLEYYDAE